MIPSNAYGSHSFFIFINFKEWNASNQTREWIQQNSRKKFAEAYNFPIADSSFESHLLWFLFDLFNLFGMPQENLFHWEYQFSHDLQAAPHRLLVGFHFVMLVYILHIFWSEMSMMGFCSGAPIQSMALLNFLAELCSPARLSSLISWCWRRNLGSTSITYSSGKFCFDLFYLRIFEFRVGSMQEGRKLTYGPNANGNVNQPVDHAGPPPAEVGCHCFCM